MIRTDGKPTIACPEPRKPKRGWAHKEMKRVERERRGPASFFFPVRL